jgi:hypothetical protein
MSYYSAVEPTVVDDDLLLKSFQSQVEGEILKGNVHPDAINKKLEAAELKTLRLDYKSKYVI